MGPWSGSAALELEVVAIEPMISERDRLRNAETALAQAAVPVIVANAEDRVVSVSPAFSALTGYSSAETIGRSRAFFEVERDGALSRKEIARIVATAGRWEGEAWHRCKSGELLSLWVTMSAVRNERGAIAYTISTLSDIGSRRDLKRTFDEEVDRDPLTGLADRHVMRARVGQALAHAAQARRRMAVLYVEMDRFQTVNERFGHAVGDAVLIAIARRLETCVRGPDSVGRMGGDDFVAILPQIADEDEAACVAARIHDAIGRPLVVKGRTRPIVVTASVGIAIYPEDADSAGELIRKAAAASYHAKEGGHDAIQFFAAESVAPESRRLGPQEDLRRAIEQGDLVLEFEPRVRLGDGSIAGAEALVRWQRADRGLVPPVFFIPLAEETGLIEPLGQWVLDAACAQLRRWREEGLPALPLAVNLSMRQFSDPGFLDDVRRALAVHGVPPGALELEITESALMEHAEETQAVLREIRRLGVRLTADDFGTGYSSLRSLRGLPLDAIKIDRAFVSDIGSKRGDPGHVALAAAVVAMGRSLGMKVIAEGVETPAQVAFLRTHGCDEIQGFCFSPPVAPDVFSAMVRQDKRL